AELTHLFAIAAEYALDEDGRVGLRCVREQHEELVAAVARGEVHGAGLTCEDGAERTERRVARNVSVRVVVILESVEVEHHADEHTTAACSGELPGDVTLELPTVRQSGERVRVGQHVHLLEEPGVLDRNGGLVTECAEQLQVL